MRKKLAFVAYFSVLLLAISGVYATTYANSVFRPNGVLYRVNIDSSFLESSTLYNASVRGYLSVVSKDIDLSYIGWGFYINITYRSYVNNSLDEEKDLSLPIPPVLLANKVGTRELHATDILLKALSGEIKGDLKDIASQVYTAKPVDEIYMYNVFFIPTDVNVGTKIPFGFVNETSDEKYVEDIPISSDSQVELEFGRFGAWVIELSLEDIPMFKELINENISELTLKVYYDKSSGWLLKADISINVVNENESFRYRVNGGLELVDSGNVLSGSSYINKFLGFPPYTLEIISSAVAIIAIVKSWRRQL